MLKDLIAAALKAQGLSMRQACKMAGIDADWLKHFMEKTSSPGVDKIIPLANALQIDRDAVWEAIERDSMGGKRRQQILENALKAVHEMNPAEQARLAARRRRH